MWVRFSSKVKSPGSATKLRMILRKSNMRVVIEDAVNTVSEVRADHHPRWTKKVADQVNHDFITVQEPQGLRATRCGFFVLNAKVQVAHQARCNSCRRAVANTQPRPQEEPPAAQAAPRNGPVHIIASVPAAAGSFNKDGLVALLGRRADEAMELATKYEAAAKAITELDSLDILLAEMQRERENHAKALDHFLTTNA
jgi:hypothetical protein